MYHILHAGSVEATPITPEPTGTLNPTAILFAESGSLIDMSSPSHSKADLKKAVAIPHGSFPLLQSKMNQE